MKLRMPSRHCAPGSGDNVVNNLAAGAFSKRRPPATRKEGAAGHVMITITVNGKQHRLDIEPETPLLWVIRDEIGLTGTKYGCGISMCGACTVHVNGEAVRSCGVQVGDVAGKSVTTIEGLSSNSKHPVQQAWLAEDVPQCGYCQSGLIMAAVAFLKDHPQPSDADIDANLSNICRCGTYVRVRRAIHRAAALIKT